MSNLNSDLRKRHLRTNPACISGHPYVVKLLNIFNPIALSILISAQAEYSLFIIAVSTLKLGFEELTFNNK